MNNTVFVNFLDGTSRYCQAHCPHVERLDSLEADDAKKLMMDIFSNIPAWESFYKKKVIGVLWNFQNNNYEIDLRGVYGV